MPQIKFPQIFRFVVKYARAQLVNARYARIKKLHGVRRDEDGRVYAYATTYSTKVFDFKLKHWVKKPIRYYDTFVMVNPKKRSVVLSCSCADFMYRHEVALWKRGGAELEYSNGMAPKKTNPKMRATCCKHCLRLYQYLSTNKKYSSIFEPMSDLTQAIGSQWQVKTGK